MEDAGGSGARHTAARRSTAGELVWKMAKTGRVHYVALLLSDYGRQILTDKYDAFTTDKAYTVEPGGLLGPVGRLIDRFVLNFPLHVALRQRLALVVDTLTRQIEARVPRDGPVQVLSAPCGLARDVITTAQRLREGDGDIPLELTGVDIDETGTVLEEAARRAAAAGVEMEFLREDLFAPETTLSARASQASGFDLVNSIGLTAWIDLPDVERLAARYAELLAPGGSLVIDNFREHKHSHLGDLLEMPTRYHPEDAFRAALESAGFEDVGFQETDNGIVTVWTATLPAGDGEQAPTDRTS